MNNTTTPLQDFIAERSMSISELARNVDLAIPHVWRMVNGHQPASDGFKWRFLQAFGADAATAVFDATPAATIAQQPAFVDQS